MEQQDEWDEVLDSVLFSIRISRHASTGISPYRMLYNKDPVLPFQYKDRLDQCAKAEPSHCLNLNKSESSSVNEMVEELETNRNEIFEKAAANIKKAQKVQARNYNKRNSAPGAEPLKLYDKCLKKNMKAKSRKEKMLPKFTGPYLITGITPSGYKLRNKYAHQLKRAVPAAQLVRYYGAMNMADNENEYDDSSGSDTALDSDIPNSCQRSSGLVPTNNTEKKDTFFQPVSGQIIIIPSQEQAFSSSEESLIDVCGDNVGKKKIHGVTLMCKTSL